MQHYLRGLKAKPPMDFSKLYKRSPPEAVDLLRSMLVFNPEKRISVQASRNYAVHQRCHRALSKVATIRAPRFTHLTPRHLLFPRRPPWNTLSSGACGKRSRRASRRRC